ncbi:MAG: phosphotransferase, partial [Deltaproteobacteria bacterium]|nr:phosphotransferase [Deltaproteobacteria bacterium]
MGSHHAAHTGDLAFSGPPSQDSLIQAMRETSFYGRRRPAAVEHLETHISHVFLTDDLVYKVKKAVRFAFLDYSTLARRRYFLHEEFRLNRRLAPSVYLGVLPISYGSDGWELGSNENPVEYTLIMRRLPARRMLDRLLESNQVTPQMMRSVAEILAPFHTQAPTGGRINLAGHPKQVRKLWKENLSEIFPLVGRLLDAECFGAVSDFGERFLTKYRDLMERRFEEGWIREVHGDLHCEHVCFAPEGIQIFDCIEFSQKLRCCDLASEIAFLLMDLEVRGAKSLGKEFLTRYLELMDDRDLPSLLPFYKCYRAMVRGKVEGLRPNGASAHAMRYFEYAGHVTWEGFKPFIIIVCGLTGSGKSTLARALSQRLGVPVINSDATRKA